MTEPKRLPSRHARAVIPAIASLCTCGEMALIVDQEIIAKIIAGETAIAECRHCGESYLPGVPTGQALVIAGQIGQ